MKPAANTVPTVKGNEAPVAWANDTAKGMSNLHVPQDEPIK
nr:MULTISPECIES: hypothetical protein [Bacillaceae]